jgi:hypothetical protein
MPFKRCEQFTAVLLVLTVLCVLLAGVLTADAAAVKRSYLPYVARRDGQAPPALTPTPVVIAPPERINPPRNSNINTISPQFVYDNSALHRPAYANVQVTRDAALTDQELAIMTNPFSGRATSTMTRNLAPATTYYWRARSSYDGTHWGAWSEVWTFTTPADGPLPGVPGLITPANGSTLPNRRPTFNWNGVPLASEYLLIVRLSRMIVAATQVAITSDLQASQVYSWSVTARTGYGWGTKSSDWTFTTAAASPAEAGRPQVAASPAEDRLTADPDGASDVWTEYETNE